MELPSQNQRGGNNSSACLSPGAGLLHRGGGGWGVLKRPGKAGKAEWFSSLLPTFLQEQISI